LFWFENKDGKLLLLNKLFEIFWLLFGKFYDFWSNKFFPIKLLHPILLNNVLFWLFENKLPQVWLLFEIIELFGLLLLFENIEFCWLLFGNKEFVWLLFWSKELVWLLFGKSWIFWLVLFENKEWVWLLVFGNKELFWILLFENKEFTGLFWFWNRELPWLLLEFWNKLLGWILFNELKEFKVELFCGGLFKKLEFELLFENKPWLLFKNEFCVFCKLILLKLLEVLFWGLIFPNFP